MKVCQDNVTSLEQKIEASRKLYLTSKSKHWGLIETCRREKTGFQDKSHDRLVAISDKNSEIEALKKQLEETKRFLEDSQNALSSESLRALDLEEGVSANVKLSEGLESELKKEKTKYEKIISDLTKKNTQLNTALDVDNELIRELYRKLSKEQRLSTAEKMSQNNLITVLKEKLKKYTDDDERITNSLIGTWQISYGDEDFIDEYIVFGKDSSLTLHGQPKTNSRKPDRGRDRSTGTWKPLGNNRYIMDLTSDDYHESTEFLYLDKFDDILSIYLFEEEGIIYLKPGKIDKKVLLRE